MLDKIYNILIQLEKLRDFNSLLALNTKFDGFIRRMKFSLKFNFWKNNSRKHTKYYPRKI